jgi:hypothetical protein
MTAYSIYSQLEVISCICNLRTRHAVVTRDPPNMEQSSVSAMKTRNPAYGNVTDMGKITQFKL